MARKDRGRKEVKRPKQNKAKKGLKKLSDRAPLREPERPVRSTAVPQPRDPAPSDDLRQESSP